jgi:hypothetical protein
MLRLVGQAADGWIPSSPYVPPEQLPDRQAVIDDAARQAGRDPGSIRRIYNVTGRIGERRSGPFVGPVAQWIDVLTRLSVDVGMTAYVYWPEDDHVRQLELFAAEVAPAVREAVATSQGNGASRSR